MAEQEHPVWIVGAGPGDPGLITLKAVEVLSRADVVVYDRLVEPMVLEHARPQTELIYVGKEPGRHVIDQARINALLIERARAGLRVCRLKGGDPTLFGRGGEEALALVEAGLRFEFVPGVTSALAVPAYAGIPVTHRGVASSVAIVTGHKDPATDELDVDWDHLARGVATVVFLMGVKNLRALADALVRHGRAPHTPVALIRWGTTPFQKTLTGTLADIADKAKASDWKPPSVIVVGDVVGLRDSLAWFEPAERPVLDACQRALQVPQDVVDVLDAHG